MSEKIYRKDAYKQGLDLYQNIQFWHDQLYAKVRIALITLGGILALLSFFIAAKWGGIDKMIESIPAILKVLLSLAIILCVFNFYQILRSLTFQLYPDYSQDDGKPTNDIALEKIPETADSWYFYWSPTSISETPVDEYVEKFKSLSEEQTTTEVIRYVHLIGSITENKINIANSALWFNFTIFVLFSIVIVFG